jgi:poly-gamma-glutamate capsule biosynthesis protein CapA/YwtB (metallophosphatase superfamily)
MNAFLFSLIHAVLLIGCEQKTTTKTTNSVAKTQSATNQTLPNHVDTSIQPVHDYIDIVAVGDIMLGTNFPDASTLPPNPSALLLPADSFLQNASVCFGNLEGTFLNQGGQSKGSGPNVYNFRQPETYATVLKNSGFDFLSIANNHIYDFGQLGMDNTCRVLNEQGFKFAGTKSYPFSMIERGGLKIGLVAFAPHSGCLDINDQVAMTSLIKSSKPQCDILLVSFHAGAEGAKATHVPKRHEIFYDQDRGDVYQAAHAAIDAGADLVIGHGPHVPRALELYKSKLIAYSLGNFCTYAKFNLKGISGYAPLLSVKLDRKGSFIDGQIKSFLQLGEGGPVLDKSNASAQLIRQLSLEDFPESPLNIDAEGKITIR